MVDIKTRKSITVIRYFKKVERKSKKLANRYEKKIP
jgi:hypothetical protein